MATTIFSVVPSSFNVTRGVAFSVAVSARDENFDVDTGYAGTIHFTSSDPAASLPGDTTLTAGAGNFNVTLNTVGGQTVTVTDTVSTTVTGHTGGIFVQNPRINVPITRSRISVPWTEEQGDSSQSAYTLGYDDSQITQEILVRMDNLGQAVRDILGFHYRQGDSLIRQPPIQHALFPSMYAVKIARILPQGFPGDGNVKDATIYNLYTRYEQCRLLIVYQNLPYNPYPSNIFPDVAFTEAGRYCVRYFTPTTENVAIRNGTKFKYVEGPFTGQPIPDDATPVRLMPKADVQFIWHHVPDEYLMNEHGVPVNIYGYLSVTRTGQTLNGAIGKVNKTQFLGYPPQTLLMMPPRITPVLFPSDYKIFNGRQESVRLWDVEFNVRYFNPPRDPNGLVQSFAGHNLMPHPNSPYWFAATNEDTGEPLYKTFEFRNMFAAANAQVLFEN